MAGSVDIRFFGLLRRSARAEAASVEAAGLTVLEALRRAEAALGASFLDELLDRERGLLTGTIILVNGDNVRLGRGLETPLAAGDRIDLFSPAGGG